MKIRKMIEVLPDSVKKDIADFQDVKLKNGKTGTRVVLDRLLTDTEKTQMSGNKNIIGIDCVAFYKYAPEIKHSYFYLV